MINFTDPNLQGKIKKAFMVDLQTGKKYPLTTQPDSRNGGQLSRNLFFQPIKIPTDNKIFTLKFRFHFGDKRIDRTKMDPFLDLEIYDKKKPKIPIRKYGSIHNTEKSLKDCVLLYDLSDKTVTINDKNVPINYMFMLEMTKEQTISARARIRK